MERINADPAFLVNVRRAGCTGRASNSAIAGQVGLYLRDEGDLRDEGGDPTALVVWRSCSIDIMILKIVESGLYFDP